MKPNKKAWVVKDTKCRGTVWEYVTSAGEGNRVKLQHPATFPDRLAEDLIRCYSNAGDTVLDPFMGSRNHSDHGEEKRKRVHRNRLLCRVRGNRGRENEEGDSTTVLPLTLMS